MPWPPQAGGTTLAPFLTFRKVRAYGPDILQKVLCQSVVVSQNTPRRRGPRPCVCQKELGLLDIYSIFFIRFLLNFLHRILLASWLQEMKVEPSFPAPGGSLGATTQ